MPMLWLVVALALAAFGNMVMLTAVVGQKRNAYATRVFAHTIFGIAFLVQEMKAIQQLGSVRYRLQRTFQKQ